jgi:hypothetical protein
MRQVVLRDVPSPLPPSPFCASLNLPHLRLTFAEQSHIARNFWKIVAGRRILLPIRGREMLS